MQERSNKTYYAINLIYLFLCAFSTQLCVAEKILLTGGAGFIGSHVAEELLRQGSTVIIIDNINDGYDSRLKYYNLDYIKKHNIQGELYFHKVDIRDFNAMSAIFQQYCPDKICHLAARAGVRTSLEIPQEYMTTNIVGTLNIFDIARKYGIKHVVYASSSSVYGNCGEGPFSEDLDINRPISPYAMTKCANELLAYTYYHLYGIGSTGLRFFTVYGPRGRMDMAPFIFMDALHNNKEIRVFGDGSAQRDFTYVDDIVDGIIRALNTPLGFQVLNLGRGEPVILRDFIGIMEDVTSKKAQVRYEPELLTDVFITHARIDKARALVGYIPRTSVAEGLRKMYTWYTNEYCPIMSGRS